MSDSRLTRGPKQAKFSGLFGVLVVFASFICAAQTETFVPADFSPPNVLETIQISLGDLPRGSSALAIRCQAFIDQDGSVGKYHCLSDSPYAHRRVISAVIDVIPQQSFAPAKVNGENVRVLMDFAVLVDCSSGSCAVEAVRNHGYHLQNLGFDYVSPQPILKDDGWYEGFDYKLKRFEVIGNSQLTEERRFAFIIAADVTKEGQVETSCLYWTGRDPLLGANDRVAPLRTAIAIENAVESMGEVQYVPGFHDGEPVEIRLYEYSEIPNDTEMIAGGIARKAITVGCQ
jgi:hypothetical protein